MTTLTSLKNELQWFPKFPAIFCNAIFVKMAGNLSYFAKKSFIKSFFVQFNFELEELVLERFDNAVFSLIRHRSDAQKTAKMLTFNRDMILS